MYDFYSAFDENQQIEFAELIIALLTRRVLEMRPEELEEVCGKKFIDASEARSEFYLACLDDKNIKAIGFSHDNEFPIRRESFTERAIRPVRSEEVEEEPSWAVHIENISVTSPNWEKNDQQYRQWKGKDSDNSNCLFTIEDPNFWSLAKIKGLRVEVVDELRVQWAIQYVKGKPKKRRVLRVLQFNRKKLSDPLTDAELQVILRNWHVGQHSSSQTSLFDE